MKEICWLEAFMQMFPRVIFPLNSWRLSTTSVSPHFLVSHLCHICHLACSLSIWMSTQDLLPRVMPPKKEEKPKEAKRGRWVMHLCSRVHLRPCCRWMCVISFHQSIESALLDWIQLNTRKDTEKRVLTSTLRNTLRHKWQQMSIIYCSVHASAGMWPRKHF